MGKTSKVDADVKKAHTAVSTFIQKTLTLHVLLLILLNTYVLHN